MAQNISIKFPRKISKVCGNHPSYLAHSQSTPFFTGVFGRPNELDVNGQAPGGGGVSSFAAPSVLADAEGEIVNVLAKEQWSLMDTVGVSSDGVAGAFGQSGPEHAHGFGAGLYQRSSLLGCLCGLGLW